jgi:hypothetical protein
MDDPRSPGGQGDNAAVAPSPRKLSDLLTAFGAAQSPASASRMRKQVPQQNQLADPLPDWTPAGVGDQLPPRARPQYLQQDSSTDAESTSSVDVIHGMIPKPKQNNEQLLTMD